MDIKTFSSNSSFARLFLVMGTFCCTSGQMANGNLKKLATANNIFALNLHRTISAGDPEENVFFSPLSLSTVLGMLYYGVRGESAKELRQALGYEDVRLPDEAIHATFHQLLNQIANTSKGYILKSASAILVDEHLSLRPEYKRDIQDLYHSPVREVNFARDGQEIVEGVNGWVEEKTGGKIRQVLEKVHPLTAMVLLNVVYFKGKWKIPFHPRATRQEVFFNGGLETGSKVVPMMIHTSATFPYAVSNDFQAVELPYVGENLSMLILLPKRQNGLPALENNLTSAMLNEIRQKMSPKKLDLHIPKFKMEFSKNLSPYLQRLGVNRIFRGGSEDFSGLSVLDSRKLFVAKVIHKSKIEVNEEGTEAAASTTGLVLFVRLQRKVVIFRADHPFVFFILDKRTGLTLFMGSVSKL